MGNGGVVAVSPGKGVHGAEIVPGVGNRRTLRCLNQRIIKSVGANIVRPFGLYVLRADDIRPYIVLTTRKNLLC